MHENNQTLAFPAAALNDAGLNLQAIFDLSALPDEVTTALKSSCPQYDNYRQLILIGHGGRQMWDAVQQSNPQGPHPIDDYTIQTIRDVLDQDLADQQFEFVYPATQSAVPFYGLQALGILAGWHHNSPFMVGINDQWGSWYAYRAVILAASDYPVSAKARTSSPCVSCLTDDCVKICPAGAVKRSGLDMKACLAYRKEEGSKCADKCLARIACPVGRDHRYGKAQMAYHYGQSLKMIKALNL